MNRRSAPQVQALRERDFRLNQKILQLETLYETGLRLGGSLLVEEIVGELLLQTVAMVDARAGFLFLKDEGTGRLSLVQHAHLEPDQLDRVRGPALQRSLRQVRRSNAPVCLSGRQLPRSLGFRSLLLVPLGREGILGVVDRETRDGIAPFDEEQGHLVELACRQAGAALANARLYRQVTAERNLNHGIISSIANGVISTDLRGRMVRVNPVVERLFAGETTFAGRSCPALLRRHGCIQLAAAVRASLADGQERQVEAEQLSRGDTSVQARISPRRSSRGSLQGLVVALEDLTEQTRLRGIFRQYVSDQVVDLLLPGNALAALGGERRRATMLFVDLAGSTELMHRLGAEQMVSLLNDCLTGLVEVILGVNGTLDKFTGDGFLAVFGVPVAFPDDAVRAAESALAIQTALERFNREHGLSWGIRSGLSQGEVIAGNLGSPRRMEYTVIGPPVNLAARLCDRARSGEILTDAEVHASLCDRFELVPLGDQGFKGIRQPVPVFRLVGHRGKPGSELEEKRETQRMTERPARVGLSIPLVPDMELAAAHTAEAVGGFMGLDTDKIEEVKMALIEACINAIEHSQSKDDRLEIGFDIRETTLTIVIADRGHGFDVKAVREGLQQRRASGEQRRGWGLRLMEELMDEVDIQSDANGTTITMVKHR